MNEHDETETLVPCQRHSVCRFLFSRGRGHNKRISESRKCHSRILKKQRCVWGVGVWARSETIFFLLVSVHDSFATITYLPFANSCICWILSILFFFLFYFSSFESKEKGERVRCAVQQSSDDCLANWERQIISSRMNIAYNKKNLHHVVRCSTLYGALCLLFLHFSVEFVVSLWLQSKEHNVNIC